MQGLSASIPLTINTPGHFLESEVGLIGLSATVLSVWSLCIPGAVYLFDHFSSGGGLDLNALNMLFLVLGLMDSPRH